MKNSGSNSHTSIIQQFIFKILENKTYLRATSNEPRRLVESMSYLNYSVKLNK